MNKTYIYIMACLVFFASCMGSKKDKAVDDILAKGKIDPNLVPASVGYVPIQPFFTGFTHPIDVVMGFDELLYVIDDKGLNILDQAGRLQQTIYIPGATDVTQDRRLHTYVAGRVNIIVGGQTKNVAAVYHLINTAAGNYQIIDTIIHPYCDATRTGFGAKDEEVKFTGLACTADNTLYVARTGLMPENSPAIADNNVLIFSKDGINTGYANGLSPNAPSLKSVMGLSSIATFAAPPQRVFGMNPSADFMVTQAAPAQSLEFRTLWIKQFNDPDVGITYIENTNMLNYDNTRASSFLYKANRFENPADVYIAGDQSAYIFVVDANKDSLFQFTSRGYEGVNPPANYGSTKQLYASFGGKGQGLFNFDEPSGVCYFKRMIFVADKNNNRICRFKLSTDLE
ncbi:MAG: hypothetical protein SGJ10_07115 [Bacteroidota bacterium]|nr:hypothetical protein [Bacteroidota bacterium]